MYYRFSYLIILFLIFQSCGTESTPDESQIIKDKITGYVQKGPFISGTSILMNELNSELTQTGNIFTSSIKNDLGLFELNNVELNSSFVEFTSSGFYFNEVSGELSVSQLTLTSLSDIEDKTSINVNVLTHLEKKRVETLIKEGNSFSESKKQSRDELLSVFLMSIDNDSPFENFDISQNTEEGGVLLGISVILQGKRSIGELTELLSRIQNDFSTNGKLDDENLLNNLRTSTSNLDFKQIREHIESRLSDLNIDSPVPDFEKQLSSFLSGSNYPLTITIEGEGTVEEQIISQSKTTDYPYGTVVELTPTPSQGWEFVRWSGDMESTEQVIEVPIDRETNITVTFQRKEYPLNITIEGEGTVEEQIISQSKTTDYPYETVVELTPTPSQGWEFVRWSGDMESTDQVIEVTVDGETNITGTFQRIDYPLNITIVGNGTVEERSVSQPKTIDYSYETVVELTPVPETGWVFGRWEGDLTGVETPKQVVMDGEKNVSVIFRQPIFKLGDNGVTVVCENVKPEEKGIINGVEYEVVDNSLLRQRKDEGVDMTKLCTSLVTDMSHMFMEKMSFNQDIGNWDVSNVTNMNSMFQSTTFNQDIGSWDVSNVEDMSGLFYDSEFDSPIGEWDVGTVKNMFKMFNQSQFNQDIGGWDVSNVINMVDMFKVSLFNQNISNWCVEKIQNQPGGFSVDSPLTEENSPNWGTCPD